MIKNSVFQKVLSNIGSKYTEDYILVYEDALMTMSLLQIADSYYLMKEKGYYYNKNENRNNLSLIMNKEFKLWIIRRFIF